MKTLIIDHKRIHITDNIRPQVGDKAVFDRKIWDVQQLDSAGEGRFMLTRFSRVNKRVTLYARNIDSLKLVLTL